MNTVDSRSPLALRAGGQLPLILDARGVEYGYIKTSAPARLEPPGAWPKES